MTTSTIPAPAVKGNRPVARPAAKPGRFLKLFFWDAIYGMGAFAILERGKRPRYYTFSPIPSDHGDGFKVMKENGPNYITELSDAGCRCNCPAGNFHTVAECCHVAALRALRDRGKI